MQKKEGSRDRKTVKIFFDGSSLGNPGPAGGGVVMIGRDGKVIFRGKESFGRRTNNESEYLALLYALQMAVKLGYKKVLLYTDSTLLYSQLMGKFKVKAPNLKPLHERVRRKLASLQWKIIWISRQENREADRLAVQAARIGGKDED